ncbi:hypothetical protein G7048_22945 [Diaphorobacter sp. HDW4B]|uniref:hypothetical protein n=1 Tax=Diaphorobacter sp. HDW4B TaxID=2714925 RepID=UPI00140D7A3A|nr:hypothetical protein [Diaphorobacter sp. HDW4B]QIL72952.1 hypothetical protein G7048_22945 [Diaphorobacter sp. HDW4B]
MADQDLALEIACFEYARVSDKLRLPLRLQLRMRHLLCACLPVLEDWKHPRE